MDYARAQYEAQQYKIQRTADMKKRNPMMTWEQAEKAADGVTALESKFRASQTEGNTT